MMADDIDLLTADGLSAQKAVIGSMLIDDRCVGAVLAKLAPEDFSDGPCRNTYRAIKAQFLAGRPIDPVLIQEQVGGGEPWARWAAELMQETPTAANVEYYADVVRQRINPAVGTVEHVDDVTCVLHTGADTVETLAVHLGLLGADFRVTGPPELLNHLGVLADRYRAASDV